MRVGYLMFLLMGYGPMTSYAVTTVIFDSGQTTSLLSYFTNAREGRSSALQNVLAGNALNVHPTGQPQASITGFPVEGRANERQQVLARSLPVRTPELTPGLLNPVSINIPSLARPIFVVGADRLSAEWLGQHRTRLIDLHAVGLVVNVETVEQLATLKQWATPLELHAFPASLLAKQFTLAHYPALISASRIEQ